MKFNRWSMVGLSEALKVAQTTRNAFNYWLRAGLLSTKFAATDPGVARALSPENVLELAFMSAGTEIGMSPRVAVGFVATWLAAHRRGRLQEIHVQRGGKGHWVQSYDQDASIEEMARILGREKPGVDGPRRATVFAVIHLGEIVRRVDELFGQERE